MKKTKIIPIKIALILMFTAIGANAQNLKTVCPDLNKEPCVTARKMIIASQVIAMGDEPKGNDWTYTAESMLSGMYSGGSMYDKFTAGLKLSDAVNYWKGYLASPLTGDGTRMEVLKHAYFEVYGRYSTIEQNNYWIAQMKEKKAWYSTIVGTEQKKLYSDSVVRKETINRVYSVSMGRTAKQPEIDYWLAHQNDFRQMFTAARVYLYSNTVDANKDLHDTVRRALSFLTKQNPTEAEITAAIEKYKAGKKVHAEMIGKMADYGF